MHTILSVHNYSQQSYAHIQQSWITISRDSMGRNGRWWSKQWQLIRIPDHYLGGDDVTWKHGSRKLACIINVWHCADIFALSEHQNVVPQVGWIAKFFWHLSNGSPAFFGKFLRVTIYHIALCLPIKLKLLWHPFPWWLFKSFCPTNLSWQGEHDRGQRSLWNFLICRRNLRTVLEHSWTQHCTRTPRVPGPVPLADITRCTSSSMVLSDIT